MRIGIDLMGGDSPPTVFFEAVLKAAQNTQSFCTFVLFVTHNWISILSTTYSAAIAASKQARFEFYPCSEFIAMGDEPLSVVRTKKDSSVLVGIKNLKLKYIDAFVSAGNTGALIAAATLLLPKIGSVKRPALLAALPTNKRDIVIIDVGGNISCKASLLLQFASMGIAYCHSFNDVPVVGLLNIGAEDKKGSRELQEVYRSLEKLSTRSLKGIKLFHFAGNVEGRDVFNGNIDLLVTDGFTGNIFLKTVEGTASFILNFFDTFLCKNSSIDGLSDGITFKRLFSYKEYPGAILCGIDGVVVKCHGEASASSIYLSILKAQSLVQEGFISKINSSMSQMDLLSNL